MTEQEMRDAIVEILKKGERGDGVRAVTDAAAIQLFASARDAASLEVLVQIHLATLEHWFERFRGQALKQQYSDPIAAKIAERYDL